MANLRKTALMASRPRTNWSGTYADERNWASMFRTYSPQHFGLMSAQTFSTQLGGKYVNKPLLYLTKGMGNTYNLRPGHHNYRWSLATEGNYRATITAVDTNLPAQPGKAGTTFRICVSKPGYQPPMVLKTEGRDMPMLRVVSHAESAGPTQHWLTVTVQSGNPNDYVDPKYLQVDRTIMDASTSVTDAGNMEYSGIETGSSYDLQSHIGYFARKIEVSDKFIRLEKDARQQGGAPDATYTFDGQRHNSAVGTGYVIVEKDSDGKISKEKLNQGSFITQAQALLEERLMKDVHMNMVFGRQEVSVHPRTGKPLTVGAGWFQMSRDGNYDEHSGNITLSQLVDQIESLYFNAVDPENRKVYIHTGQIGLKLASRLIEAEAGLSPFIFDSSYFVSDSSKRQGLNAKELAFGAQFTEFRSYNGVTLCFVHDVTKDSFEYYPELDPDTGKPIESGSFDIFDLGTNSDALGETKSNMAFVQEPDYEENFGIFNVYDPYTGSIKDGSNANALNKDVGFYRATSGKLEIWDLSRTMRVAQVA